MTTPSEALAKMKEALMIGLEVFNNLDADEHHVFKKALAILPIIKGALMPELEKLAEALWIRDYPNGGSIVKSWNDNQFRDKELYRKEAAVILAAIEKVKS